MARSGLSGWAKKNQWYQFRANVASHLARASLMGTPSMTTSRLTASGWSSARRSATQQPRSCPTAANVAWPSVCMSRTMSAATARLDCWEWSGRIRALPDWP